MHPTYKIKETLFTSAYFCLGLFHYRPSFINIKTYTSALKCFNISISSVMLCGSPCYRCTSSIDRNSIITRHWKMCTTVQFQIYFKSVWKGQVIGFLYIIYKHFNSPTLGSTNQTHPLLWFFTRYRIQNQRIKELCSTYLFSR